MSLSNKLTYKGTLRQIFYLSETPLPFYDPILLPPPPYTLYTCIQYIVLIHTGKGVRGGGELTREKVRGAKVHKAGQKYQHDCLYLQCINSIKHQ
jgi:hypothetical protein